MHRIPDPHPGSRAVMVYSFVVRALGIDYGTRRIGLALSDATGMLARPWKTIAVERRPGASGCRARGRSHGARPRNRTGSSAIALGYPRRLNGSPTDQTAAVEAVAAALRSLDRRSGRPSGRAAEQPRSRERLARRHKDWRKRKQLLDAASAAVILQDYLDERARHAARVEGENV